MTTYTQPEIDFSTFPASDGKPMADHEVNQVQMIDLIFTLRHVLEPKGHHVGGNLLIYYDPQNGWNHLAPDVFVALDAGSALRASWKTWEEGKFPEVIFEIASPSTQDRDLGVKLDRYAWLGAQEYFLFDPAAAWVPPFQAYRRVGTNFEPLPVLPNGGIFSVTLDLEFRVIDKWLRVIDPETGQPYRTPDEVLADQQAADAARRAAEAHASLEEQARIAAEARVVEEEQARLALQARMAQLEAELHAARIALERRLGDQESDTAED